MKLKSFAFVALMAIATILTASNLNADEKKPSPAEIMKSLPDKPIQTVGIVLIDALNPDKVILLTQINLPGAKGAQGTTKMIGIPLEQDKIGKEVVEKFGIVGIKEGEEGGMERIQKASDEKAVFVDGTLNFKSGAPTLIIKNYQLASEFMAKMQQAQQMQQQAIKAKEPK